MLFIDIRDFTGFAEQTPASQVVSTINRMFERAVPIIHDHGGHVDKFVGDGLLAVFGAPQRLPRPCCRPLSPRRRRSRTRSKPSSAAACRWASASTPAPSWPATSAAPGRFEFSVIGDPVNVAARIEAATRQTGDTILISGRTLDLLDDGTVRVEERPDVVLKGKSGAVSLFAVQPAIGVEPAAGLPAEQSGMHHPGEQRGSGVERLLELLVQGFCDGLGGVEPDEIGQGKRALRVSGAEHEALGRCPQRSRTRTRASGWRTG